MKMFIKAPYKPEYQCTHYFIEGDKQDKSVPIRKTTDVEIEEVLETIVRSISNSIVALNTCCEGDIPPTENVFDYLNDALGDARDLISEIKKDKDNG